MADGGYRFSQPGAGPFYFPQHNQQHHHHQQQRHIARNGSPVNNGRGNYTNDTPSPSRSPVSQASSYNPYAMHNQGHQQSQNVMMNGHHQRYMQSNIGHKYQQQGYQQQHSQQNQHHQQPHTGNHGIGHQQTFSSGTLSNATPHFTPNNLHNGTSNNNQGNVNDDLIHNPHWQRQLQLLAESRQAQHTQHVHCKKEGVISRLQKPLDQVPSEEQPEEAVAEERNRATANCEEPRQDWNGLDFSGQHMKALSPVLFRYKFLHKLYLDHNALERLDPAIGQLRSLSHLDISNNLIKELPEEIGMLVNLTELLVFDNRLHTLPVQIGHLFKLEMLGIEGNSMIEEIRDIVMHQGTKALVTQFREHYSPGSPPNERRRVLLDNTPAAETLSVVSYNILCDKYATTSLYGYTPSAALAWDYRKNVILDELNHYNADIICLQEVDRESFDEFFRPELAVNDYRGVFWPKSRAKTMAEKEARLVDGCATFYKGSKYICLDKVLIDFANTAINRPDMKGEHDTFNRVMPRDHIAVASFFENKMTGSRLMVVNAHIFWDPAFADVKLVQVAIMMEQLSKQADRWAKQPPCTDKLITRNADMDGQDNADAIEEPAIQPRASLKYSNGPDLPLIICGDFNSAAGTGVYDLITAGSLPGNHVDLGNRRYGNFTRDGMAHPFKLKSAYTEPEQLCFTNYVPTFNGIIDYIWYSENALEVRELLGNVDEDYLRKVPGFPNHHFPSDHLAIKADFTVKQRKETKGVEANGE